MHAKRFQYHGPWVDNKHQQTSFPTVESSTKLCIEPEGKCHGQGSARTPKEVINSSWPKP